MSASTAQTRISCDDLCGYVERGWWLVPAYGLTDELVCTCHAHDRCEHPGKHPRGGRNAATNEISAVLDLCEQYPSDNWIVVTGQRSGLLVLDADGQQGIDSLGRLMLEHGPLAESETLPDGAAARSGRGYHIYLGLPIGLEIPSGAKYLSEHLGPGLEVKAEKANINLPGSRHASGAFYEWIDLLPDGPLPMPRPWLIDLLTPPKREATTAPAITPAYDADRAQRYGLRALEQELAELAATPEGQRNHRLNQAAFAAGQLVGGGCLTADYAVAELVRVAVEIGLTAHESKLTVTSGMKCGLKQPRGPKAGA